MSEPKEFRTIVGECIGEASMCWHETPTGVFDSERASKVCDKIFEAFHLKAGMGITRWNFVMEENFLLRQQRDEFRAALSFLLNDTQHSSHTCGDDMCPVERAREVLAKYPKEKI